jgi:CrcB protein
VSGEGTPPVLAAKVLAEKIDRAELTAIAVGGAVGAVARVGLTKAFPTAAGSWPWATFAVNIAGAFLLGCLLAALKGRRPRSVPVYRLLGTGFCSTATTFATVQVELLRMLDRDRYGLAAAYIAASVAGGYLAVSAGRRLIGQSEATQGNKATRGNDPTRGNEASRG